MVVRKKKQQDGVTVVGFRCPDSLVKQLDDFAVRWERSLGVKVSRTDAFLALLRFGLTEYKIEDRRKR